MSWSLWAILLLECWKNTTLNPLPIVKYIAVQGSSSGENWVVEGRFLLTFINFSIKKQHRRCRITYFLNYLSSVPAVVASRVHNLLRGLILADPNYLWTDHYLLIISWAFAFENLSLAGKFWLIDTFNLKVLIKHWTVSPNALNKEEPYFL
ncbi:MAG: hypothetical protein KA436_08470 [Oligoflexales bacterium]|nr:hypothetical protein [Oligoflexales bacterium]